MKAVYINGKKRKNLIATRLGSNSLNGWKYSSWHVSVVNVLLGIKNQNKMCQNNKQMAKRFPKRSYLSKRVRGTDLPNTIDI